MTSSEPIVPLNEDVPEAISSRSDKGTDGDGDGASFNSFLNFVSSKSDDGKSDAGSDTGSYNSFLRFIQTDAGKGGCIRVVKSTVNNRETPPSQPTNKKQLNSRPSFYSANFSEHFFPVHDDTPRKKLSLASRYGAAMARRPATHLLVALVIAIVLSFLGLKFGKFEVAVDNSGWWSRGTTISNRATQELVVGLNRKDLFYGGDDEWVELQTVTQPNWQSEDESEDGEECVRTNPSDPADICDKDQVDNSTLQQVCRGDWYGSREMVKGGEKNLVGVWKTIDAESSNPTRSALEADAMYDLCVAEKNTLEVLQKEDLCYKCSTAGNEEDSCIEPYSLVLMARLFLADNYTASYSSTLGSESFACDDLRTSWTATIQKDFTSMLQNCVAWAIAFSGDDKNATTALVENDVNMCPYSQFLPTVVDELFPTAIPPVVRYTSSFYATKSNDETIDQMYSADQNNDFDRSDDDPLSGVYDTTNTAFYDIYSDSIVGRDMSLAVGSAGVTFIAMMIHTKSPFLTLMGLLQILLSFPLAYFVYYFIGGLVL